MNKTPLYTRVSLKSCFLGLLTLSAICASVFYYVTGMLQSPLSDHRYTAEAGFLRKYINDNDPDLQEEKALAEGYWLRYPDVKINHYWGVDGPMGIWGPRDHYLQHGKREGRIFQPIHRPSDMTGEAELAEAYWNRYPVIKTSPIWGVDAPLGILGPRDHYRYRGRFEGKIWGTTEHPDDEEPTILKKR